MAIFGQENPFSYMPIVFIVFAVIAAILGTVSLIFLQKLIILPVFLLPLLCFCICYENTLLSYGNQINSMSNLAYAGNVFHSLSTPLFLLIQHETSFKLYQSRSFQFCCIRFDQDKSVTRVSSIAALFLLWGMRIIACGLFVMKLLAAFNDSLPEEESCDVAEQGYMCLCVCEKYMRMYIFLYTHTYKSYMRILLFIYTHVNGICILICRGLRIICKR